VASEMDQASRDALSADIHFLGDLLGQAIRRLAGEDAFALEEEMRAATKALRERPSVEEARQLMSCLARLPLGELRTLLRAFTVYFDLINLAEQEARVRALRERASARTPRPVAESVEEALRLVRSRGVSEREVSAFLDSALLCPVFTAHPTEARRRTILEKLWRIDEELDRRERMDLSPRERELSERAVAEEIEGLWLTETVRAARPSVLDEVQHGLEVIDRALVRVIPHIYRDIEDALRAVYPERSARVPTFLRFGSWIGGDRDGNPNVTPEITVAALRKQAEVLIQHYIERLTDLSSRLSHSAAFVPPPAELTCFLAANTDPPFPEDPTPENEPYKRACRRIIARLRRTLEALRGPAPRWMNGASTPLPGAYIARDELLADLRLIAKSLAAGRAELAAMGSIEDMIRLVEVLGLHMLTLDIRQHSARHAEAMDAILRFAGVTDKYTKLTPDDRLGLLERELEGKRPLIPAHLRFEKPVAETIETLRTVAAIQEQQCLEAIDTYIISMAKEPANVLEVLLLAREAGLFRPEEGVSRLNIVPLFETLDALVEAPDILTRLFQSPVYAEHLRLRGNVQEVMIGYSDSNKESGFLQSVWALYRAERSLAEAARARGILLQTFHGRGGAIGRGGGPANRAILAQPRGAVRGRLRVTEQGEVIADRYGHPAIAERHLTQLVSAVLLASFPSGEDMPEPSWEALMDRLAASARRHYRALVYETPEFLTYFEQATPITELSKLRIGSRPARRGRAAGIEDLRAIPWVMSFIQSRHTLPGWYGLGSAIEEYLAEDPEGIKTLQAMYGRWPFWRTAVDNAQMILAKADMTIARLYADLAEDQALAARIFGRIEAEHKRTALAVCRIAGNEALLDDMPVLKRSIERRNPYVDLLSLGQLVLLRRLRESHEADKELEAAVLESISGVAAGMKNTG
jgi:phosphoenolpyruvate carboxylase